MKSTRIAVIAFAVLASSSWGASAVENSSKAASADAAQPPIVRLETHGLAPKAAKLILLAEKECQCSKWEITYEEECVAWDGQGNCTKKQTVRRRKCIEWDHCHDKA